MYRSYEKLIGFFIKNSKIYHGCYNKNKIRIRKVIAFKQGELCVFSSKNPYWKSDLKEKFVKPKERKFTRQYGKEMKQNNRQKYIVHFKKL